MDDNTTPSESGPNMTLATFDALRADTTKHGGTGKTESGPTIQERLRKRVSNAVGSQERYWYCHSSIGPNGEHLSGYDAELDGRAADRIDELEAHREAGRELAKKFHDMRCREFGDIAKREAAIVDLLCHHLEGEQQ